MSLSRRLEVEAFDQPLLFVSLAEFFERFGQFLQGREVPHPENLFLEMYLAGVERTPGHRGSGA
ncbi:MAG: hypothetical protein KatS3mg004_3024 [Bryobacteraceae bacterium]|nr:MAG: hypothetical protein KatS3mg004_3024 [Bryobacteraceae bacterium]